MNNDAKFIITTFIIIFLIVINHILLITHSISEQTLQTLYKFLFTFILMSSDKLRPDLILKIVTSIMKP